MKNNLLTKLHKNEKGATTIEYGLVAVLIVVASMGALTAMSSTFITNFNITSSKITSALQ